MKHQKFSLVVGVLGILCAVWTAAWTCEAMPAAQVAQEKGQAEASPLGPGLILKSFTLKYIKPEEFLKAARFYDPEATFIGNKIMLRMVPSEIPRFEKLLASLDVEPKVVLIRAYPIHAFRKQEPKWPSSAADPELKKVLDEMNALWKFEQYYVEGPSFITVKEMSGPDSFKLLSNWQMNLLISGVKVTGEESGKRSISIGQLRLSGQLNFLNAIFMDTHDIVLKEKGYLVAGVSGFSGTGEALILVINAEIK